MVEKIKHLQGDIRKKGIDDGMCGTWKKGEF